MAKKGMPRHTLTRIRQPIAMVPSPSHRIRCEMSPTFMSTQLNTLNVASNIHCQASVLRTVGTIQGRSIPARTIRLNRKWWFRSSAATIPRASLKKVAMKV